MTSELEKKELNNKKIAYTCYFIAFIIQTINFATTGSDIHNYNFTLHFLSGIIISVGSSETSNAKQTFNDKLACICLYPLFFFPISWIAIIGFGFIAFLIAKLLGRA